MIIKNRKTGEIKELCYGLFRTREGKLVFMLGEKEECLYSHLRWYK